MDLRQLRFFVAITEERNFTRAAEKLHIAQPAVSVAIRNLEEQLGLTLFSREGKKIGLTAEGEVFLGHAREILGKVQNAEREMGGDARPRNGPGAHRSTGPARLLLFPATPVRLQAALPQTALQSP